MKSEETFSTLLGLKQEQVAMLLQVSRSRWSMYELGLRRLSPEAMEILLELTAIIKTMPEEAMQPSPEEMEAHLVLIDEKIKENTYQQRVLSDKIAALEKKQKAVLRVSHLERNYKDTGENKEAYQKDLVKRFVNKAKKAVGEQAWSQLRLFEIKIKALQQEEKLFRQELTEINK